MGNFAIFLVTIGVGYWVLTLSQKDEKHGSFGKVLGWAIILLSILGLLSPFLPGRFHGLRGKGHKMFGKPGQGHGRGGWGRDRERGGDRDDSAPQGPAEQESQP